MAVTAERRYALTAARLGTWIICRIEDGPEAYQEHLTDLCETIAELRKNA